MVDLRVPVYCDESGNTGDNLWDSTQPFFVQAGWIIWPHLEARARSVIDQAKDSLPQGAQELHATRLLRSRKGRAIISGVLSDLLEVPCLPIFAIVEKRFMVAAKVVETFLDPYYNRLADLEQDYLAMNRELKLHSAERIYCLHDTTLALFASAYRAMDPAGLNESILAISSELRQRGDDRIADQVLGSVAPLPEIISDELRSAARYGTRVTQSPNYTFFHTFLSLVESIGRGFPVSVRIVHDEQRAMRTGFVGHLHWLDRREQERVSPDGMLVEFRPESITSFEMGSSASEPLLQAADLLAGTICNHAKLSATGLPRTDLLQIVGKILPMALIDKHPRNAMIVASQQRITDMFSPIGTLLSSEGESQ